MAPLEPSIEAIGSGRCFFNSLLPNKNPWYLFHSR